MIDGDTIEVLLHGRETPIRLIGVDTPETVAPGQPVECYGPAASRFTHRALEGRPVSLEFDEERKDRYGRLLAYVWTDNGLFNRTLTLEGFATVAIYPPNDKYEGRLLASEQRAQHDQRGLWNACHRRERSSNTATESVARRGSCDSNYTGACIPQTSSDLDCAEVAGKRFRSIGDDPHWFDADGDGIACET